MPALSLALTAIPTFAALPRSSLAVSAPLANDVGNARNGSLGELRTKIVPPATPDAPSETATVIVLPLARVTVAAGPSPSTATVCATVVGLPAESVATKLTSRRPSVTGPSATGDAWEVRARYRARGVAVGGAGGHLRAVDEQRAPADAGVVRCRPGERIGRPAPARGQQVAAERSGRGGVVLERDRRAVEPEDAKWVVPKPALALEKQYPEFPPPQETPQVSIDVGSTRIGPVSAPPTVPLVQRPGPSGLHCRH